MKVVGDANVLVAGLLSVTGPPGWIVEAALEGRIEPVFVSSDIRNCPPGDIEN